MSLGCLKLHKQPYSVAKTHRLGCLRKIDSAINVSYKATSCPICINIKLNGSLMNLGHFLMGNKKAQRIRGAYGSTFLIFWEVYNKLLYYIKTHTLD